MHNRLSITVWFTAAAIAVLILMLAAYPAASLTSSLTGLAIWWQVLFPSLFPFFVITELMLGFGIVHFFGKLLDPVMRPLFRVPGTGGFVMAMGLSAGYPVPARLTAKLREQKLISRVEGERLVAYTTSSDPIFLIGAVSVGFFQNASLALLLAAAHYGSSIVLGLAMRYHARRELADDAVSPANGLASSLAKSKSSDSQRRFAAALQAMHTARLLDGRNFGQLLQDAVQAGLRLMTVVGGLVVFFSVIMGVMSEVGALQLLIQLFQVLFSLVGLPEQIAVAFANGLFEVTLGAKGAGEAAAPLIHQTAAAVAILSWGGLSVHAQIASILSHTDLRYSVFLRARFIHACLSIVFVYALWGFIGPAQ